MNKILKYGVILLASSTLAACGASERISNIGKAPEMTKISNPTTQSSAISLARHGTPGVAFPMSALALPAHTHSYENEYENEYEKGVAFGATVGALVGAVVGAVVAALDTFVSCRRARRAEG